MLNIVTRTLRIAAVGLALAAAPLWAETSAPLNTTADGIAMDGFDVVAYFTDNAPAKGKPEFAVEQDGATWLFASQAHADAFKANPAAYSPKSNGWCSHAVSEGYAAEVDFVQGWTIIDNALYLNWDKSVRDVFVAEKDKRVPASATNWPTVSGKLADGSLKPETHANNGVSIAHPQPLN